MLSKAWIDWFTSLVTLVGTAPTRIDAVALPAGQGAAIGTTAIGTPSATGLYQVAWHLRITTAAGVSSSAQVTVSWTEGGVTQSYTGTNVNGNTTTTHESAPPLLIRADGSTPVSYAVAYASNPAGAMRYSLDIVLTRVNA